jgi:hypothetical protein
MARVPTYPYREITRHRREKKSIVKPEGRFVRTSAIRLTSDRSPKDVTSIAPHEKMPVLPEMPYIPPA